MRRNGEGIEPMGKAAAGVGATVISLDSLAGQPPADPRFLVALVSVEEFVPALDHGEVSCTAESSSAPEQIGFRAEHDRNVDRSAFLSPRRSHRHGRVLPGSTRDECGPRSTDLRRVFDAALNSARAQQGRVVGGRPCRVTATSWRRADLIRRRRRRSDRVRRSLCRRRSRRTPC